MFVSKLVKHAMAGTAVFVISAASFAAQAFEPTKPIDFVIMAGKGGGADR